MTYAWQMKKYENSSQGQRSRTNVTGFQALLSFTGHISTKLHQFLISSNRDFVQTVTQTQMLPKTTPAHSMNAGKCDSGTAQVHMFTVQYTLL